MKAIIEKVYRVFGVTNLFPEQEKALKAFIDKSDVLLNLPTGFGKSLVFQMTPFVHGELSTCDDGLLRAKSHRRSDFPTS